MCQAEKQLTSCKSVQGVLHVCVEIVGELTGFHRVMFYCFDSQKNGRVDAELLNPQVSTDLYLGKSAGTSKVYLSTDFSKVCTFQPPTFLSKHESYTKSIAFAYYMTVTRRPPDC